MTHQQEMSTWLIETLLTSKKKKNLLLTIINMLYCSLVWEYKNQIFKQKQYF